MRGRIAVAVSGGRDSTALLHATVRAVRGTGVEVHALHVHHGLLPQADAWVEHLRRQCLRWRRAGLPVQLVVTRLQTRPQAGDSIEAWARRERYRALADMARALGIDTVLLAHHRRDQAETFLLQALRGAGAAGLAGMPAQALRDGIRWLRPWLDQPRRAIEAYLRRYRLGYVDDSSNDALRFARNRLRHSVWPPLEAAFADAETTLAAACRRAHEAAACAAELAAIDRPNCVDLCGHLLVFKWSQLGVERRANLLRSWLGERLAGGVPETLLQRLMVELPATGERRRGAACWPSPTGPLRLHRGLLQWAPQADDGPGRPALGVDLSHVGPRAVPEWGGAFNVTLATGQGIPVRLLAQAELRPRQGGEQFQHSARSSARSLKKQYQACGVPAWARGGPLVYAADRLLFVPGLGIDGRVHTVGDEPTRGLIWTSPAGV